MADSLLTRYPRWPWYLGLVIIFMAIIGLIAFPGLRAALNGNEGAIMAILTALLVLLYFAQYHLQSVQLRFQNSPHLDIQRYETDGRHIEIWLSNHGNGLAKNIEIETCIDFPPTDNFRPGCASRRLRRVDEDGDYKRRVGNSLRAGEHWVRFIGDPSTEITPDDENHGWGLIAATGKLLMDDVEAASFDFRVVCEDMLGNEHRENIFGRPKKVELQERGMTVDDIRSARGIDTWENW